MVTKTQFPSKSHHNIALVPLNNTRQQIKPWSPPTSHNDKKWTTNSPPWRWLIPLGRAKHLKHHHHHLKHDFLVGPRWCGAQDNKPYGGISIKTQKSEYEKIRIFNAWSIEKCTTPKQYLRSTYMGTPYGQTHTQTDRPTDTQTNTQTDTNLNQNLILSWIVSIYYLQDGLYIYICLGPI
jgi:hypothetical protein